MKDSKSSEVDLEEWKVDGWISEKMYDVGRLWEDGKYEGEEGRPAEGEEESMEGGTTTLI